MSMSVVMEAQERLGSAPQRSGLVIAHRAADLLNSGNERAALVQCERLVDVFDLEALDIGLWVAHTTKADDLAGRLHQQAARLAPLDAERQRSAAAFLLSRRKLDQALSYAAAACELAPEDADAAFLLGVIRNEAGLYTDAVRALLRAVKLRPGLTEGFHHLAFASMHLGLIASAADLALCAFNFDSANPSRAAFAAHLLRQAKRLDDAIEVLRVVSASGEAGAALQRTLSDCLFEAGHVPEALAAIDTALGLWPGHPEYQLFRASLLTHGGKFDEAVLHVDAALLGDPENLGARRHAVTLYLEGGRFDRAIAATAELLRRAPDDAEYASCMMHVLSLKVETPERLPDLSTLKRNAPPRPKRPAPTLASRLCSQGRVTVALLLREMRTRFGESRLGYLWVILEMVIHLGVLAIVFQFVMHGDPPMGHSFFFFYFTGLTPYILFLHTSDHVGHSIVQNRHILQLPMVTNFNVMIARALLELFTSFVISGLFIIGFLIVGIDALPHDFVAALCALLAVWLLGFGFGMISAVFNTLFHFWHHIVSVVIRMLYFCSGIFYVPSVMPAQVRDIMAWNPLLHCVDWLRTTVFEGYQPHWLDCGYALVCGLGLTLVGLLLEGTFRRQLRQPA